MTEQSPTTDRLGRLSTKTAIGILAALTLVAFLPSLGTAFVFDDRPLIVFNTFVHGWHHVGRAFSTDLWATSSRATAANAIQFYRPIITLVNIACWQVFGKHPWGFHLVNVLAHLGAVLLAFRLASRWTESTTLGLAAATAFAIHPTRAESVVWISGRTDVLMALFLFLAVEFVVGAARRKGAGAVLLGVAALTSWALALMSKEFAVALPFLLAIDYWIARERHRPERRRLGAAVVASLVLAVGYLGLRAAVFPIRPDVLDTMHIPLPLHIGYVLLTIGLYVQRFVAPWPLVFFVHPVEVVGGHVLLSPMAVIEGAVAALLFVAALVWGIRNNRRFALLGAAALILLLPVFNVSYTGFNVTVADRFTYLPILLLAAAFLVAARKPLERWLSAGTRGPQAIGLGLALVCVALLWVRTIDFMSPQALWTREAQVNPDNPAALKHLAVIHLAVGENDEAFQLLARTLQPASLKFALVAEPARQYVALLDIQRFRLADGNVPALEALLGETRALVHGNLHANAGRAMDLDLRMPDDENAAVQVANARLALVTDSAAVAGRLGHADVVREMVALIDRQPAERVVWPIRSTLAMACARTGMYDEAKRQVDLASRADGATKDKIASLRRLIDTSRAIDHQAADLPEPDASMARARALSRLGAYLQAARMLRRAHTMFPARVDVAKAYVKALVWCRLDHEADSVARQTLGDVVGPSFAATIRKSLSPQVAAGHAPTKPVRWWEDGHRAPAPLDRP